MPAPASVNGHMVARSKSLSKSLLKVHIGMRRLLFPWVSFPWMANAMLHVCMHSGLPTAGGDDAWGSDELGPLSVEQLGLAEAAALPEYHGISFDAVKSQWEAYVEGGGRGKIRFGWYRSRHAAAAAYNRFIPLYCSTPLLNQLSPEAERVADEEGDEQRQRQQQQRWSTLALQENNRLRQCVALGREQLALAGPVLEAEAKLAAVGIGGMLRRLSTAVASGATAAGGMLAKLIDCISANALASHRWTLKAAGGSAFFTAYQYDGHPGIKDLAAYIACQGSGWSAEAAVQ